MFVIWNITQRKWVAQPGSQSSYTTNPLKARRFDNYEAASVDCCGDEIVRDLLNVD